MNNNSNQKILRPMMKVSEMVPYLKNKNIKFNLLSEEEAEKYLKENNNYYNDYSNCNMWDILCFK